jgi:hypothetical protein
MERLFLEFSVRAALLVAGTAIVLRTMRVKPAADRYRVWVLVVLFMLMLPIWIAWGPKAPLRVLPPLARITAADAIAPGGTLPTAPLPPALFSIWQAVFGCVYLLGVWFHLLRLAIGTVRARTLARDASLQDGMCVSSLCAAPITVGFFHPMVIVPEDWHKWSRGQLDAVLIHEQEHARRLDTLVQWIALLNRALFWFHPAAWWLERHLSALAEEACDDVVLARGHSPSEYAECLLDIARTVTRSGSRLNITGMAMPGSFLPQRIRQIMESRPVPSISRMRMACVAAACAIACTVFAAGTLDHPRQNISLPPQRDRSAAPPATKYVLGELKIDGDVHVRDGVRDRILKAWKDREYDDDQKLVDEVFMDGIRLDFQDRGYFRIFARDPVWRPLDLVDGRRSILVIASLVEGDQYWLGTLTVQNIASEHGLSVPPATLRDLFHIRSGDLFNVKEIQGGLERLRQLYRSRGFDVVKVKPDTVIDDASHHIDLVIRITEGPHTP